MSGCHAPVPPQTLADYWLGEVPAEVAEETEAHLMACGACSARMTWLARLGAAVRSLVRQGRVPLVVTPGLLARLEQDGIRIRHHRVDPGGRTACTAGPDDDLVAVWLEGDFRAGERVDLVFAQAPDVFPVRQEDLPVDPGGRGLALLEPGAVIRRLPAHVAVVRLYGVSAAGERTIGEYTLVHTPWAAGAADPSAETPR